jgi:hypothetical protein
MVTVAVATDDVPAVVSAVAAGTVVVALAGAP